MPRKEPVDPSPNRRGSGNRPVPPPPEAPPLRILSEGRELPIPRRYLRQEGAADIRASGAMPPPPEPPPLMILNEGRELPMRERRPRPSKEKR